MSLRDLPVVGDVVELPYDDGTPSVDVEVIESYGVARLMLVRDKATGGYGVVAFQPDRSWWLVREIERREPWESDGEPWRAS